VEGKRSLSNLSIVPQFVWMDRSVTKIVCQDNRSVGRHLNPGPPEYETKVYFDKRLDEERGPQLEHIKKNTFSIRIMSHCSILLQVTCYSYVIRCLTCQTCIKILNSSFLKFLNYFDFDRYGHHQVLRNCCCITAAHYKTRRITHHHKANKHSTIS
jgi:hypothetical protein